MLRQFHMLIGHLAQLERSLRGKRRHRDATRSEMNVLVKPAMDSSAHQEKMRIAYRYKTISAPKDVVYLFCPRERQTV